MYSISARTYLENRSFKCYIWWVYVWCFKWAHFFQTL